MLLVKLAAISFMHNAHYCTHVNLHPLVIKLFVEALSIVEGNIT
jgi:hypothetical protein